MLKKILTNTLAQQFSWAGKTKRTFKDLKLADVIKRKFTVINIIVQFILIKVKCFNYCS